MSTKNPRVNVALDKTIYSNLKQIAERDDVSLSNKVRDLIKEALDTEEDVALAKFAENALPYSKYNQR